MENIKKQYQEAIKYFINKKIFISIVILITILSFGFAVTNSSVGMDDTAFDRYYQDKEMLAIGRWGSYLVYQILNITEFIPFWIDFIASSIIMLTAVLWCIFLKKNLEDKLSITAYIIFASIFISFPIINEIFIFQNCNIAVMLGSLLASIGIMLVYENFSNIHKKSIYIYSALILTLGISMYEACAQIVLVSILIIAFLIMYKNGDKRNKNIFKYIFIALGVFIFAIILNSIIVKLICLLVVNASNVAEKQISWGENSLSESLALLIIYIVDAITNVKYFPVLIFDISAVIGLIVALVQSYKKQNFMILFLYTCMLLSNFAISMLQLKMVLYRTCTSWSLFVAAIIMVTYNYLKNNKITKVISSVFIIILILQQTKYLNQMFYNDYIRYQKDLHVAYELIDRLEEFYDISKPLVITGKPEQGVGDYGAQSNSLSVLWWGVKAFNGNGIEYIKFLNSLGYDFEVPTDEQYKKGKNETENMNKYPREGSIKELEDCIVINF